MSRIKSVIEGRDNEVLQQMLGFYARPEGPIVDVTCNAKRMWKGVDAAPIFCDIDPQWVPDHVCDFRETPFRDASVSLLVFDPPHLPSAAGSPKSMQRFVADYGLGHSVAGDGIESVFAPFLKEAARILKPEGLIFAKLCDFVHNHKYQWTLVEWVTAVRGTPGLTATDLIIKRDPSAGNLASGRWKANHHARRSHCWWAVVRKGGCESKVKFAKDSLDSGEITG